MSSFCFKAGFTVFTLIIKDEGQELLMQSFYLISTHCVRHLFDPDMFMYMNLSGICISYCCILYILDHCFFHPDILHGQPLNFWLNRQARQYICPYMLLTVCSLLSTYPYHRVVTTDGSYKVLCVTCHEGTEGE